VPVIGISSALLSEQLYSSSNSMVLFILQCTARNADTAVWRLAALQVPPYVAQRWREAIARAAGSAVDEDGRPGELLGQMTLEAVSTRVCMVDNMCFWFTPKFTDQFDFVLRAPVHDVSSSGSAWVRNCVYCAFAFTVCANQACCCRS
jgi:hypothetical protein